MRQRVNTAALSAEHIVKAIRRATRKHFLRREKIPLVLLRRGMSFAAFCRREYIAVDLDDDSWARSSLRPAHRRHRPCRHKASRREA
jgi:transposase